MKMNPSRERYIETQVRTGSFEEKSGKGAWLLHCCRLRVQLPRPGLLGSLLRMLLHDVLLGRQNHWYEPGSLYLLLSGY